MSSFYKIGNLLTYTKANWYDQKAYPAQCCSMFVNNFSTAQDGAPKHFSYFLPFKSVQSLKTMIQKVKTVILMDLIIVFPQGYSQAKQFAWPMMKPNFKPWPRPWCMGSAADSASIKSSLISMANKDSTPCDARFWGPIPS